MADEAGRPRTVGVEEELLLVDPVTGRPQAVAGQVLRGTDVSDPSWGTVEQELQQEQIETDSAPQRDLAELERELREGRRLVSASAREAGAVVIASGTSPIPVAPVLTEKGRYRRMVERFGITAAEQLTCGCHVHVAIDSDEEAVGVVDRIREWLPVLLAISSNSPFWQGKDTGYASFRAQVWARWPSAGPAEVFGDFAAYRRYVRAVLDSGVVLDEGMLYADARPSRHYPTVELRVADVCMDVRDAVTVAGLARALVDVASAEWAAGEPPRSTSVSVLRLASWQAAREGLSGALLDPLTHRPRPAREVLEALLERCGPALQANGDEARVEAGLQELLARGTGAARQRAVHQRTCRLEDVVTEIARVTSGQA